MTNEQAIRILSRPFDMKNVPVEIIEAHELAIKVLKQDPETDGWHDSEKPPKNDKYVLLSFSNYPLPCVGRYYGTDEEGSNYYEGDEEKPLIEYGLFVNGWMELPKCRRGNVDRM